MSSKQNYNQTQRQRQYAKTKRVFHTNHEDKDIDFVEAFQNHVRAKSYEPGAFTSTSRLACLESDWAMREFDFEADLRREDARKAAIIADFQRNNPDFKKSDVVCTKWLEGLCMFQDHDCEKLHVYDPDLFAICRFYIRDKQCTNPNCPFRHPGRDDEIICVDFANGFCKNGPKCDFVHRKHDESERENIARHSDVAKTSHREAKRRASKLLNKDREFW